MPLAGEENSQRLEGSSHGGGSISPPDPGQLYPMADNPGMVFLRPLLERDERPRPRFEVGDFTYYSDFEDPTRFFEDNVLYDFGYSEAKLVIGKYCSLAHGCRFLLPDANHAIVGPSAYPFPGSWSDCLPVSEVPLPPKGDTVVGHDVWIGYEAVVMPGVRIGHGAVIGARSVVTRDVPPYAIAAGNPARTVRMRFSADEVERLLQLAWWHWPPPWVQECIPLLIAGSVGALVERGRRLRDSAGREEL